MATPAYAAPQNNVSTDNPTYIQQFLGTHGITGVYQGSSIVSVSGSYGQEQTLAGYAVDQPFTMSGTTISRVEIPASIATGVGQDITVALYADSGGSPTGSAIASVTFPMEFWQ